MEMTVGPSPTTSTTLDRAELALLGQHRVQGVPLLPGLACVGLLLEAARELGADRVALREVRFESPILLDVHALELRVRSIGDLLVVESVEADGTAARHASARLDAIGAPAAEAEDPESVARRLSAGLSGDELYRLLEERGNQYGPVFRGVETVWKGEGETLSRLHAETPSTLKERFGLDPLRADAALHALGAAGAGTAQAFVLAEIAEAALERGACPAWSRVCLGRAEEGEAPRGDVWLHDAAGRLVGTLRGVRLAWLASTARAPETLAVSATFTAEPLDEVVGFWADQLGLALKVQHAPFGQVFQQLLDPGSLLRGNRSGVNVLAVRLEDWTGADSSPAHGELVAEGLSTRRLPDGREVAHLNAYETDYLYQEIFRDRVYLRHGIEIGPGDCVIDVGANIGMFALFARAQADDVRVLAFEPSPRLRPILEANALLAGGVRVFPCGVSDREGSAPFTFYARSSVFSSYRADAHEDEAALRAVIGNMVDRAGLVEPSEREAAIRHFLAGRLEAEVADCPLRTLSSVIDECGLERIDLLKVDAEKSESAVLAGLREEHWPRVRQIVLEVHDRTGEEPLRLAALLRGRGFEVSHETEDLLGGSGLHTLYARRTGDQAAAEPAPQSTRYARLDAAAEDFLLALPAAAAEMAVPLVLVLAPHSPASSLSEGWSERLDHWQRRIAQAARALPGVEVLLPGEITARYPVAEVHDRLALDLGHVPYTAAFFTALGTELVRRFVARRGSTVKVVAVDADETLWSGVVGEVGSEGVVVDEGRAAFQRFLVDQVRAGRLLCVSSKNRLADVRAVFRDHAGMILREEHVAAWRVDWQPKSVGLRSLAAEWRLGLESFVLLDDSPVECAEVAARATGVTAVCTPRDSAALARAARQLWLLDGGPATAEDAERSRFYAEEHVRERARAESPGFEAFLESLQLKCEFAPLRPQDVERVAQLTERTNQFNLARRPCDAARIRSRAAEAGFEWRTVRVADRFGDYGLVGVLGFVPAGRRLHVDTFLLSCRALGRGVERRMLQELARRADALGLESIELPYVPAARSAPMRRFLDSLEPHDRLGDLYLVSPAAAQRPDRAVDAEPAAARAEASSVPSAPAVAVDLRREASAALRIATQLATVEQIEAAVQERRRGGRQVVSTLSGADPIRRALGDLWGELLGHPAIGLDDDFLEMGGTSLLLVQAMSRASRIFGHPVAVDDAFRLRTIETLAAWLEERGVRGPVSSGGESPSSRQAAPEPSGAEAPASHAQQALYYLHQLAPSSWAYNIPFAAHTARRLDAEALRRAFVRLLARHETLRAGYAMRGGQCLSRVLPVSPDFEVADASSISRDALRVRLRDDARLSLDLRRGPVARLRLYHTSTGSALLLVIHHVAIDLWSLELVISDLLRAYLEEEGGSPVADPPGASSYAEFARREQVYLDGPEGERAWSFWKHELEGPLPSLALEMARDPGPSRRFVGSSYGFRLDPSLVASVRRLARETGATVFQALLAGYAALLRRHTTRDDLLIGTPFSTRGVGRFDMVVGDFANVLPLRMNVSEGDGFRELVKQVSGVVVRALAHHQYPLPLLVKRLGLKPLPGRLPLVQTSFALHEPQRLPGLGAFFVPEETGGTVGLGDLELTPMGLVQQEGQFDVAMEMVLVNGTLWGTLKFDEEVIDARAAALLAARYAALLADATRRPQVPLKTLSMEKANDD
jgi:FkbH-like protein/FkbM family methyltransferase